MSTVIDFPKSRRIAGEVSRAAHDHTATVIILPVVRIERCGNEPLDDVPAGANASGRRRRRSRS
jgi:hypothetical protein